MINTGSNALGYGIVPSAPASLSPLNINDWKDSIQPEFFSYLKEKHENLIYQYNILLNEAYISKKIYESEISFKPIIGKVYFLYERKNGVKFLSMLSPMHTKWQGYLGSYKLNINYVWEEVT
jgi:hypothetical protein